MHGVTGRMGMNQHLIRSILAIRAQGGVTLSNGDKVVPDPIIIGRNADRMEALAKAHNIARWTARIGLDEGIVTTKTLRRRLFGLPGRLTSSARRFTSHLPARWPWAVGFVEALARFRALPLLA